MLEEGFEKFYLLLRKNYYERISAEIGTGKNRLSATECFCLEVILLMEKPNISTFAAYLNISLPNATYRVSSLIRKGYLQKLVSETDRREALLRVTDKYKAFYSMNNPDIHSIIDRIEAHLSNEELVQLSDMLRRINEIIGA